MVLEEKSFNNREQEERRGDQPRDHLLDFIFCDLHVGMKLKLENTSSKVNVEVLCIFNDIHGGAEVKKKRKTYQVHFCLDIVLCDKFLFLKFYMISLITLPSHPQYESSSYSHPPSL